MAKIEEYKTLEEALAILLEKTREKSLTIKEIVETLSGKGRSLILIFLSLPFCLPVQIPAISLPFGLIIALIGLRSSVSKHIWLPQFLLSKKVSAISIQKIIDKSLRFIKKMKCLVHSRLNWVCHNSVAHIINGLVIFFLGIFLALPLPIPFTNLAAAWSIFFIALGLLEDDGVFVLIGYLGAILTLTFLIILGFSIKYFINPELYQKIFSFFG